jgi:lysyl-tRNA synthetase class 2
VRPFAYRYERTHTAAQALAAYQDEMGDSGPQVRVAGRLDRFGSHGKTAFGHLEDPSGRIQIYFRRDALGPQYQLVELLDLDDHIGVEGTLFRTKKGEITIRADSITMLAKSLRPLPRGKTQQTESGPVSFGDLQDPEVRYRQRYADLAVHPEVRQIFRLRARAVAYMRRFLDDRGFLEVETPILQPLYGGAAARPFVTHHHALDMPLYLRIADELYLKRLLVGGFERVYEIGHDFRNEGMDRTHNPEFTMLEFYQAYADYAEMMTVVESLMVACSDAVRAARGGEGMPEIKAPFPRIEWVPAFAKATGIDPLKASVKDLLKTAEKFGVEHASTLSRPKLMDEIFQAAVESTLQSPTFVIDYPKELSPLAKPKRGNPDLTERFELFANGREMANAFSELNDPLDQRARLEAQAKLLAAGDEEASSVDEDYLRAMEYGMPPMGGVGIGIDRLFMYLTNTANIRDAILFPTMRPEA